MPVAAAALAALALAVPHPTVRVDACPGIADATGCYVAETDTVYITPDLDPWRRSITRWHELGHAADAALMDDGERHAFSCLPAVRRCGQPWQDRHVNEVFADAYRTCKQRLDPEREGFTIFTDDEHPGYDPVTTRRHVNACRFLQRALSD